MRTLPWRPNTLAFPIFWLPLVVPFFLAALAVVGDSVGAETSTIAFSSLKNIHLAYISFDLWAFATLAAAGPRLEAVQALSYFSAVMIALLFHTLFYLLAALLGPTSLSFILGLVAAVVGGIGGLLVRVTLFERIECVDLFSRRPST
jgi:hypothetical protein